MLQYFDYIIFHCITLISGFIKLSKKFLSCDLGQFCILLILIISVNSDDKKVKFLISQVPSPWQFQPQTSCLQSFDLLTNLSINAYKRKKWKLAQKVLAKFSGITIYVLLMYFKTVFKIAWAGIRTGELSFLFVNFCHSTPEPQGSYSQHFVFFAT